MVRRSGCGWVENESGAPFGEAKAHFAIFAEAFFEVIEAFGISFIGLGEIFKALIDFDAGHNAMTNEKIWDGFASVHKIASGFVKKDDTV